MLTSPTTRSPGLPSHSSTTSRLFSHLMAHLSEVLKPCPPALCQDKFPLQPSPVMGVSHPHAWNHWAWRWDQSPSVPHCHFQTILLPSPSTSPQLWFSLYQTMPRFTPPSTTPPPSPSPALLADLRALSPFPKTTPVGLLGGFSIQIAHPSRLSLSSSPPVTSSSTNHVSYSGCGHIPAPSLPLTATPPQCHRQVVHSLIATTHLPSSASLSHSNANDRLTL